MPAVSYGGYGLRAFFVSGTSAEFQKGFIMNSNLHSYASVYRKLVLVIALCSVVGGVFLCLTYLFAFDSDIHHFDPDAPVLIVFLTAFLAGTVLLFVNMLLARKKVSLTVEPPTGLGEVFFGFFTAILYAICFLREVADLVLMNEVTVLEQTAAYTAVLPALYLMVISLNRRNPVLCTILAFGGAGATVASMFRQYFDLTLPLNGPVRIIATVTSAAMLLFFLSEARMHISLRKSTSYFFILANGAAGLFMTGIGLAQAVFSFFDTAHTFSLIPQMAMAGLGGLAYCRLYRAYRCWGDYMPPADAETADAEKADGEDA